LQTENKNETILFSTIKEYNDYPYKCFMNSNPPESTDTGPESTDTGPESTDTGPESTDTGYR